MRKRYDKFTIEERSLVSLVVVAPVDGDLLNIIRSYSIG